MRVEKIAVTEVRPAAYNPRKDLKPGDPEYDRIKASLDEFDVVEPLVWNKRTKNLVSGHQRFKILQARGDTEVYVSVVDLDDVKEKALNVAMNKVGGGWDDNRLGSLLLELEENDSLTLSGFGTDEFEKLVQDNSSPLFSPETQPELGDVTVHADDVTKAKAKLEDRMVLPRELREVKCPTCGAEFALDK